MIRRRTCDVRPSALSVLAATSALVGALLISGCGGAARQDAHEPTGAYAMRIVRASFPAKQSISQPTRLELQVRNSGSKTVPNVAVTLDSLNYTEKFPELAADKRPIWAIERGPGLLAKPPVPSQEVSTPGSGGTAYVNTWALGPLAPGRTQTFTWRVVAVKSGIHTVRYSIAADVAGKAKARTVSGGLVHGQFTVDVAAKPPNTYVNPNTGRVTSGTYPPTP